MTTNRLGRTALAGLVATAVVATGLWQAASADETPATTADGAWTGTWSASPHNGGASFDRQTLRQIVHTSISGTATRIQLSNAFGSAPVTIGDIHLARSTGGSSVDTSSDRRVTFGGATSVTIPAGAKAISDSVAFAAAAESDIAVSFFLPQPVRNATEHGTGLQTGYI